MVNVIALVFAGLLVAGIAVAVGCSNAGPSVALAAGQIGRLAPNYWNQVEARMQYNLIQTPKRVGPAWSAAELPGATAPKPKRQPLFQAPPPPPPPSLAQEALTDFPDDLFALPEDDANDPYGLWSESPSPLGRVA